MENWKTNFGRWKSSTIDIGNAYGSGFYIYTDNNCMVLVKSKEDVEQMWKNF